MCEREGEIYLPTVIIPDHLERSLEREVVVSRDVLTAPQEEEYP